MPIGTIRAACFRAAAMKPDLYIAGHGFTDFLVDGAGAAVPVHDRQLELGAVRGRAFAEPGPRQHRAQRGQVPPQPLPEA